MQTNQTLSWDVLDLGKQFIRAGIDLGFQNPTPIQAKAIPSILSGQNVIGIAQTGTGKTAAYILPLISKLKFFQDIGPRVLVLVPTKELTIQLANHARALAVNSDLRIVELYGGVGIKNQTDQLNKGADIIMSTPGRFMEIYLKGLIKTKTIKSLVIDEADRMMDMNFMPQLRKIFEVLPSRRQNLLFSATFPPKVEKLTSEFMDFSVRIEVTPQSSVSVQVTQSYYRVPNFKTKLNLLEFLLADETYNRIMVFVRTKETATHLHKYIERKNLGSIKSIHSNKAQNSRINSMKKFREGDIRILISTDVSARGIDIQKVSHVINFDVPLHYEDYVHRTGRTGRAFETGEAITFVTPADEYHLTKIEELIKNKITLKELPNGLLVEKTLFEESQIIAKEMDRQKRKEDPTYRGAFHERKQ